jgi:hypothetical protein
MCLSHEQLEQIATLHLCSWPSFLELLVGQQREAITQNLRLTGIKEHIGK